MMETNILDRFFNNYLTMKNRKENTFEQYKSNMKQFYEYFSTLLNTNNELEMLKKIDNDMIEDYVNYLINEKKFSAATMNNKINTWKSFYKYICVNKKLIKVNPVEGVPTISENSVKTETKEKEILTHEELTDLINKSYAKSQGERMFEFNSARFRFIISMLHSTGLRIEELLHAELSWLEEVEGGYMLLIPAQIVKNKLDKRVPICGKTLKYFREYMDERELLKNKHDDELIILSSKGKKCTTKDINEMIEKAMSKTQIDKTITSHCGRHYMTTMLDSMGVSQSLIAKIGVWKMEGVMNKHYMHNDSTFDREKIRVCSMLI